MKDVEMQQFCKVDFQYLVEMRELLNMITIIQLQQGQPSRKCNTYISPEKGQTVETLELMVRVLRKTLKLVITDAIHFI